MAFLKAVIISILAAGTSMFIGAVVLAVLNIYLAGHGIDWPNQHFDSGLTGMSPLSTMLAVFVLVVFLFVFVMVLYVSRGRRVDGESNEDSISQP